MTRSCAILFAIRVTINLSALKAQELPSQRARAAFDAWSQHALIPVVVFRDLSVPMLIIDPQNNDDDLPVTDQNEKLKALHPDLIVHRIYPQTSHAAFRDRPEWFLRDARELLDRVRKVKQD